MENTTPKYEFIKEVKSTADGDEEYYFTDRNGCYVLGSLSYTKQEAWSFYIRLCNGEIKEAVTKTVMHSSDRFPIEIPEA